ncbi:tRNA dimethylallyltransferase [Tenacibaculum litopenaei]|uniref:tRNA (adenosine(37)-N6)-dimethylallyltransferase MiaA n=1 Tax=Tenacibaculum litopenaei TaxID=396016 RepID=UPI003895FB01
MTNTLITIVGATAIGKTSLSIALAQHFNCDILSCDSRQFFKEMRIGTAVPEPEELAAAPHHFIQNLSVLDEYSVGQFERDALDKLDELFEKNPIQIMVGGSGLYVDAVLKGLDYFPDIEPAIREALNQRLESEGLESLQQQLQSLDPETYNNIAIDNPHRVIRALEVCIGTGKTYASFKNKPKRPRNFNSIKIGLNAAREITYERIEKRVDIMMNKGLLKEVEQLVPHRQLNALQTVGYRELFDYFDGRCSLETAIAEIKKNTRRFAKRQGTWFRKDPDTLWFDFLEDRNNIIHKIESILKENS